MSITQTFTTYRARIVTALVLLVFIVFIGYINNPFIIWGVLGVVYLFAFHETLKLLQCENNTAYFAAAVLWLTALLFRQPETLFIIMLIAIASFTAFKKNESYSLAMPFVYPTAGFLFFYSLYLEYGIEACFWLVLIVALCDIGAFIVGKNIGKTPFSETSPNKTREGVFGGVIIATVAGALIGTFLFSNILITAIIAFCVAVSAVFGDLFESYLKRQANVKDSGSILPGHGGILDRVDGYIFSSVVQLILMRALL